jgi:hypothetical protein
VLDVVVPDVVDVAALVEPAPPDPELELLPHAAVNATNVRTAPVKRIEVFIESAFPFWARASQGA